MVYRSGMMSIGVGELVVVALSCVIVLVPVAALVAVLVVMSRRRKNDR